MPNTRDILLDDLREGISVQTNQPVTLRLPRPRCHCLEMEDAFFSLASAVLLPHVPLTGAAPGAAAAPFANDELWDEIDATHPGFSPAFHTTAFNPEPFAVRDAGLQSIARALVFAADNADRKLIAMGHADTSGEAGYNATLSEARGKVVVALLVGDRDLFCEAVEAFNTTVDAATVLRYAARTRGWDCEVPDDAQAADSEEIEGFQRGFNTAGLGDDLATDGIMGPQTRAAWFDVFESDLALFVGGDLQTHRAALAWVDDGKRFIACGERYPLEGRRRDGFRSQTNRRVELLFFEPDEAAELSDDPAKDVYENLEFRPEVVDPATIALQPGSAGNRDVPDVSAQQADAPPVGVGDPAADLVTTAPSPPVADPADPWSFLDAFDGEYPETSNSNAGGVSPHTRA